MSARLAASAIALLLAAPLLHAATRTYPGAPPCDGPLGACIAGADPGDRIEITTATPIDEDLTVGKTLTLTAAAGIAATIGGSSTLRTVYVFPDAAAGPSRYELSGLRLNNARISADILGTSGHELIVDGCDISALSIGIDVTTRVPATITLVRNTVFGASSDIQLRPAPGTMATILGNLLSTVYTGGSTEGIEVIAHDSGDSRVDIYSNVLFDLPDIAIRVESQGTGGTSFVNIVNNTVDRVTDSGRGIYVALPQFGGKVDVNVFNNIVTRASLYGIDLPAASPMVMVRHAYNDFFGNGMEAFGGYPAGPSTLAVDPAYTNAAAHDFRLTAGSPVRNVGLGNPLGGLPPSDADGNERIAGGTVDLGAYEYGAMPVSTTTSTAPTPTTSTTIPCVVAASVTSVVCRLGELQAAIDAQVPGGTVHDRLTTSLVGARDQALAADAATVTRARRRGFGRALKRLKQFGRVIGSRAGRRALSDAVRASLRAGVPALQSDLRTLRTAG
jgi:hypothetical protein